jgi:hypothetical protein
MGLLVGCSVGAPSVAGNRIVATATATSDSEQLKPKNWQTTEIQIGDDFVAALNSVQSIELPVARIPFVTSMTFHAPKEAPVVMIGLYYQRDDQNRAAKEIMTGGTFALQRIMDPDAPLTFDASQIQNVQSANIQNEQLQLFEQNRLKMIDLMKASTPGQQLARTCDFNFTTRARPSDGSPAALVLTGGSYLGMAVPYTVFAQRLVFV